MRLTLRLFISPLFIKQVSHSGIKTLQKSSASQNISIKLSMLVHFFHLIFLVKDQIVEQAFSSIYFNFYPEFR